MIETVKEGLKLLLICAHRGEALHFIEQFKLTALKLKNFSNCYYKDNLYLVITGEGIFKIPVILTTILSEYKMDVVVNFGIAGFIDSKNKEKLNLHDIVQIKTSLLETNNSINFHAFPLETINLGKVGTNVQNVDCLTTYERQFNNQKISLIYNFTSVVDRELWAIAHTCHQLKVPLYAFKLLSDNIEEKNLNCLAIQEMATSYSEKLYHFFVLNYFSLFTKINEKEDLSKPINHFKNGFFSDELYFLNEFKDFFYLTFSQENLLRSLIKKAVIKKKSLDDLMETVKFKELLTSKMRPKERTQILIKSLIDDLYPYKRDFESKIKSNTKKFKQINCKVEFDPLYEDPAPKITMKISNQKQLNDLVSCLQDWKFDQLQDILNGRDHLEKVNPMDVKDV